MASVAARSIRLLVEAAASGSGPARMAAVKELRLRSEHAPGRLLPNADMFTRLLKDTNSIVRWNALLTVGNLAASEDGNKLEPALDLLLEPVTGPRPAGLR